MCLDEERADKLGLVMDTTIKILTRRQEIYLLAESASSYFLLPETFQGLFRVCNCVQQSKNAVCAFQITLYELLPFTLEDS